MNCGCFAITKLAATETFFATIRKLTTIAYSKNLISFLNVILLSLGVGLLFLMNYMFFISFHFKLPFCQG